MSDVCRPGAGSADVHPSTTPGGRLARLPLALITPATAVPLTACGGSDGSDGSTDRSRAAGGSAPSTTSSTTHADAALALALALAQLMTAHHEQAVERAQLAADRAGSAEVRDLAERIVADRTAQIGEMQALIGRL